MFLVLLGMGMPTPAVYIMGAALLAPVLRGAFGLPEMQVHLFMLYFACLSAITPPVAVANFAAGAIAGVNPMALGPYAVKLAIGGFILPFYFLFNPGLNMQGSRSTSSNAWCSRSRCAPSPRSRCRATSACAALRGRCACCLFGCAIATVSPRFDITLAATLLGRVSSRLCSSARPPSEGRRFRLRGRLRRAGSSQSSFFSNNAAKARAPVGSTTIFIRSHRKNIARVSSASVTVSMSST